MAMRLGRTTDIEYALAPIRGQIIEERLEQGLTWGRLSTLLVPRAGNRRAYAQLATREGGPMVLFRLAHILGFKVVIRLERVTWPDRSK